MDSFHKYQLGTEFIGTLSILGLAGATANGSIFGVSVSVGDVTGAIDSTLALGATFALLLMILFLSTLQFTFDRWLSHKEDTDLSE